MSPWTKAVAVAVVSVTSGACPAASATRPAQERSGRPHIVLAISDDQDYEHFGFLGHPRAPTPNLDRLAAQGVVFPAAYVPTSRCRASLGALLSGRHPHQSGVFFNTGPTSLPSAGTLARRLAEAGYATFLGGKFWEGDVEAFGFDEAWRVGEDDFVRHGQGRLLAFVRENAERAPRVPMFIWWAPKLPHLPHDPPARCRERVGGADLEVPDYVRRARRDEYLRLERDSLAMVAWLDEGLGELVDVLAETDALDDTLLVFLIDNGYANGLPSKGSPYEKGVRTPLIVRAPGGAAPGRRIDVPLSTLDVFPTLLDYAGLDAPAEAAGRSLRPVLEGDAALEPAPLFGAVYRKSAHEGESPEDGVIALWARDGRWKYVLHVRDTPVEQQRFETAFAATRVVPWSAGDEQLFDLVEDPYERRDLGDAPDHEALRRGLRADALRWWRATGGAVLPESN